MWKHWTDDWNKEEAGARLNMAMLSYPTLAESTVGRDVDGDVDKFFSDRDSHNDDPRWFSKKPHSQTQTTTSKEGEEETLPMSTFISNSAGGPPKKTLWRQILNTIDSLFN